MTQTFLVIYEFKLAGLIPAYHTEITIGENSFGFGDEGTEIHNIPNLDGLYGYKLITSIHLGTTNRTQREIRNIIRRMDQEWTADTYNIWTKNCRHYSLALVNELNCDSSEEGRRILAGLIDHAEKMGQISSILVGIVVQTVSLNPINILTWVLEFMNQDRLLESNIETKWFLFKLLLIANGSWIMYIFIQFLSERLENNEEDELIDQMGNMDI